MPSILRQPACLILLISCLALTSAPLRGQSRDPATVRVDGLVLDQQKYSFTMRGLDRDYRVVVPNGTPMLMKLTHPVIDFEQGALTVELLLSAPDGDPANNLRIRYPAPDPLYLTAEFRNDQSVDNLPDRGVISLDRFTLSAGPSNVGENAIQGQLKPGHSPGQYRLEDNVKVIPVQLGGRRGLMANNSIMQLRPNETEVFVEGQFEGDSLVARRIRFQHVGDPFGRFDPDLPNALVIGDMTSINYDRALRGAVAGQLNVHHPPCNCGGSENWRSLHRWLANPDNKNRRWDVIAFNFGHRDKSMSRPKWTANLRKAIAILEKTGARLVWVTTTPLPRGFPSAADPVQPLGMVQGRMQFQNQWAAEVLADYPQIQTCDLWQVVTDNPQGTFDDWWDGDDPTFNYPSSQPLARAVADALLQAARASGSAEVSASGSN